MTPERTLLVASVFPGAHVSVDEDLDTTALLRDAIATRCALHLLRALDAGPEPFVEYLRLHRSRTVRLNLALQAAMRRAVAALREAGLGAEAVGGPDRVAAIYGGLGEAESQAAVIAVDAVAPATSVLAGAGFDDAGSSRVRSGDGVVLWLRRHTDARPVPADAVALLEVLGAERRTLRWLADVAQCAERAGHAGPATSAAADAVAFARRVRDGVEPADALFARTNSLATYEPTPPQVVEAMLDLAGAGPGDVVVDLGCGDGRVLAAAAARGARAIGYEIDPELAAKARTTGAEVRQEDAANADLSRATVVTMYLSLEGGLAIRPALERFVGRGGRVVSHHFDLGDWPPAKEIVVDAEGARRHIRLWAGR